MSFVSNFDNTGENVEASSFRFPFPFLSLRAPREIIGKIKDAIPAFEINRDNAGHDLSRYYNIGMALDDRGEVKRALNLKVNPDVFLRGDR